MASIFSRRTGRIAIAHALVFGALFLAPTAWSDVPTEVVVPGNANKDVKLQVWLEPGKKAQDVFTMKVNLSALSAKRVCIAYVGFETVGFYRVLDRLHEGRSRGFDKSEHKCSDQDGSSTFKDSVLMIRRDAPNGSAFLRGNFDNAQQAEQRRRQDYRDGSVIVVVTLDGEPAIFKVKSPLFALDTMVLKKSMFGQTLPN